MKIKRYKNGSFLVRREPDFDPPLNDPDFGNGLNLVFDLVNSAELDFCLAGDEGCAGNYEMYYPLYNAYTGLLYLVLSHDCDRYAQGKSVRLRGYPLDASDLETCAAQDVIDPQEISQYTVWQIDAWTDGDGGWIWNDRMELGKITFLETDLRQDILRTFRDQLRIQLPARHILLREENEGWVIYARKDRLPLFALQASP